MNLQFALLILGVVVVGLVFALSRYSDAIENYRKKLKKQATLRAGRRRLKSQRSASQEPILGSATDSDEDLDAPLFNFKTGTSDQGQGQEYQQSLLSEEEKQPAEMSQTEYRPEKQAIFEQEEPEPAPALEPEPQRQEEVAPETKQEPETNEAGQTAPQVDRVTTLKPTPSGPFTSLRQIDYWIKLSPASPVTQGQIMDKLGNWDAIQFSTQIHALTQEEPHWVELPDVDSSTVIVDVVASYQLLTSGQASNIEDLHHFDQLVTTLGQALSAEKLMMASPEQALEQSRRLEHFYQQSHGPLEVAVCAPKGQAFMGKLVETSAKQQGLDYFEGDYVRLKRMANESIILYRMLNNDAPHFVADMSSSGLIQSVRFSMTPSLSRTPGRDAKEMLDAVKAFASRVKGDIRIPGQKDFHQDQLLNLRNRVSKLEKQMIDAGLEPGSQEIQRIFS